MSKGNIVIFLGAGFSMEAHQPVMNKFGEFSSAQLWGSKMDSYAGGFKGIGKHQHYDSYKTLKCCGEVYESLRQTCKSGNIYEGFNPDNLEDLFTYAEMREQCNYEILSLNIEDIESKNVYSKKIPNDKLVNEIKIWLWQIFRRVPIHNPSKWKIDNKNIDVKPYRKFAEGVVGRGLDNFSVLTTNYDLIVEYLFNSVGRNKIFYPINDFDDKRINNSAIDIYVTKDKNSSHLLYCKLHGSVNYFENFDDPRKIYINSDLGVGRGKSNIDRELPSVTALDAAIHILKNENLFPAIIPPSYAKLEKRNWLREIWNAALTSLINANKWIFIGYSFPPTDGHMKSLINLALKERKTPPYVVLVSPDSSVVKNYVMLLDQNFKFYKKTFSRFIQEDFENEIK